MATDTTETTATPTATETPPAPTSNGAAAPTSQADVRNILGRGMRARAAQAASLFPTSENGQTLAPQSGNGVLSGQQASTAPAESVPSESPPQEATPAATTARETTPTDTAAAPSERAETPPQAQVRQPASSAPSEQPTQATPVARTERPDLPPEYTTQEYQTRFASDPLLRRELLGIWRQPDVSDVAKAKAMEKRVGVSDSRIAAAQQSQQRLRQLRDSGNLQEWAKQQRLQEAQEAYRQQWAQGVTQLLARTLGADPNDDGFANAGAIQPGESEELRAVRFAEWAVKNSPIGQAHLSEVASALKAEHEAELAQIRAAHEEELKSLRDRMGQEATAQAAAALAQGRGTTAFPPRAPSEATNGTERGLSAIPTTIRETRGLLSAGLRLRQEAARAAPAN